MVVLFFDVTFLHLVQLYCCLTLLGELFLIDFLFLSNLGKLFKDALIGDPRLRICLSRLEKWVLIKASQYFFILRFYLLSTRISLTFFVLLHLL